MRWRWGDPRGKVKSGRYLESVDVCLREGKRWTEGDVEADEDEGLHVVKAQHMPNELSADEVAAHNVMHEPFSL